MEITDVKIFKAKKRGSVVAYANVILDNKLIIRNITLLERNGKRFISMPARKLRNGERQYRDICHPLNSEVRKNLTMAIFEAYEEFLENEE